MHFKSVFSWVPRKNRYPEIHLTDEDTEAQSNEIICLSPHSQSILELAIRFRAAWQKIQGFMYHTVHKRPKTQSSWVRGTERSTWTRSEPREPWMLRFGPAILSRIMPWVLLHGRHYIEHWREASPKLETDRISALQSSQLAEQGIRSWLDHSRRRAARVKVCMGHT